MKLAASSLCVSRCAVRAATLAVFLCFANPPGFAQTPQPVLFAGSTANNQYSVTTFLRDDVAGSLTFLATSGPFAHPCLPQAIDAKGRFLFGACGDGLAMYTFDAASGSVAEVAASPFAASTGNTPVLVAAESTGQFVYLLKSNPSATAAAQSLFLDTFQIDPDTPALIPLTTQTLPVAGSYAGSVADPNQHGLAIFLNQVLGTSAFPAAVLYVITFDPITGEASLDPTGGTNVGSNAQSIDISPTGNYLAIDYGELESFFTVYQIGNGAFTLTSLGTFDLGHESYSSAQPGQAVFSPSGQILYVRAVPDNPSTAVPFLIFDTATFLQLPSSPLPIVDEGIFSGVRDSQGPFVYLSGSNNGPTGIGVSLIDPGTGLPSQTGPLAAPFAPQLILTPILAPFGPGGSTQNSGGPALTPSAIALKFSATVIAQQSPSKAIKLSSTGQQSLSLTSITIAGPNEADFLETDTCLSAPLLKPGSACTISIVYAPSVVGTSEATLSIVDNSPGSPQQIALLGTAVAAPPPAAQVTLNPPTALTFPGTINPQTPSLAQSVNVTNSGSAPLQISTAILSGANAGDFSIAANTCTGPVAAGKSCAVLIVFTPQAAGLRSTTLLLTDNAANSPQSLAISGTGASSANASPAITGATAASISAGQTAQFNLTAAGSNFTGTLSFACTGAPFVATCTPPANVSITNGAATAFTVSVSTTAASRIIPPAGYEPPSALTPNPLAMLIAAIASVLVSLQRKFAGRSVRQCPSTCAVFAALCLSAILASGIACGGGGGTTAQLQSTSPPPPNTAATPSIQPAGGTITSAFPTITITDASASATIHYTTDGSTPTTTSSAYTNPFPLSSPTTVQAIATAPNLNTSAMAVAKYAFQTPSGTFSLTLTPTATTTVAGVTRQQPLSPVTLTLTVK